MLHFRALIPLIIILCIGIWMLSTGTTSADLVAERNVQGNAFSITTLSFVNIDTANFAQLISFFVTPGIVPGGFDARTIRIEKNGEMDVQYSLQALKTNGHDPFCQALELQVVRRDLSEIYNGKLLDLSIQDIMTDDDVEEWVFFLSFDDTLEDLKGKTCDFDLYMRTYRNEPNEEIKGIHAKHTLSNTVTSGTW
ncbi:MAG: hypothetical protein O3B87_01945 [bacterium]|nr:hypothetical protein [bacterium]